MILDIENRFNNLRISYFDKQGDVKVNDYRVENIQNWQVCSENDPHRDRTFRNWDGKPVKKSRSKFLNKWSIYEFIHNNSDIDALSALNFPKIYSIDIETEVIDGFPNPEVARERITTIAIAMQNKKVLVLGWKPIDQEKQKKIFDDVRKHMKDYGEWDFKYKCFDDEYNMLFTFIHQLLPKMAFVTDRKSVV